METESKSYLKASFLERFLAVVIDGLILSIPTIILNLTIFLDAILDLISPSLNREVGGLGLVLSVVVGIIYNVWLVSWKGATIGKKVMRIRVVSSSYKKASVSKIVLRETIGKLLSRICFLGYLWVLIDKKRQSWHDKIAGTYVVKVDRAGKLISGEDAPLAKKVYGLFLVLLIIFVSLLSFVILMSYLFIAQPTRVFGQAMAPNYLDGQYYLVDKISYKSLAPARGDVIVFKAPNNPDVDYVKRVVGMPGEEVKIQNGKVYINGQVLPELYLSAKTYTRDGSFMKEGMSIVVPKNNYFLLGDNRDHSSDSRAWGFVPRKNIIGKFWFRYH